jgi:hypothetical protein
MALSARQRPHTLEPSHLDFFSRQRSQALQTRFLMLPSRGDGGSTQGLTCCPIILCRYVGCAEGGVRRSMKFWISYALGVDVTEGDCGLEMDSGKLEGRES